MGRIDLRMIKLMLTNSCYSTAQPDGVRLPVDPSRWASETETRPWLLQLVDAPKRLDFGCSASLVGPYTVV
jgi:hypothetical protein